MLLSVRNLKNQVGGVEEGGGGVAAAVGVVEQEGRAGVLEKFLSD